MKAHAWTPEGTPKLALCGRVLFAAFAVLLLPLLLCCALADHIAQQVSCSVPNQRRRGLHMLGWMVCAELLRHCIRHRLESWQVSLKMLRAAR